MDDDQQLALFRVCRRRRETKFQFCDDIAKIRGINSVNTPDINTSKLEIK